MAGKCGRGRTRKPGKRSPSGRLVASHDHGNERVQAMRAMFAVFQGGKAAAIACDPIGKAFAAGLLENHGADPQMMLAAGRDYGEQRRQAYLASEARTGSYERRSKSHASTNSMPGERRFARMCEIVADQRQLGIDAFYSLCVDRQTPDYVPSPLVRLINHQFLLLNKPLRNYDGSEGAGPLPAKADWEWLERGCEVLVAIVQGAQQRRVA